MRHRFDPRPFAFELTIGTAWTAIGLAFFAEPIAFAFWGLIGVVAMLPMTMRPLAYGAAVAPIVVGVALASGRAFASGGTSAIVVASVAMSLWGGVRILRACRLPIEVAIAWLLAQSTLFLTWPIWAARLLLKFDSQLAVDWLVWTGPLFAINRAIDPTDPFTHWPGAYQWMNLGQDVPYALPATIWPCVVLHVAIGLIGLLIAWWERAFAARVRKANRHDDAVRPS